MQRFRCAAAYLVFSLAVLAPAIWSPPCAGAPDSESRDKAKSLVQQGTAALAAHDLLAAAWALSAAYRLVPSSGTLFHLGQLAVAQGLTVEAQDCMRRYLHDTADPEASPLKKEAQRILLLPGAPSGEVSVVGDPNAVVLVDDRVVGVLPLPLPLLLPIGSHRIVVERGALRLEDGLLVMAGRTAEVRCQFHPGVVVVTFAPALLLLTDPAGLGGEPLQQLEQQIRQAASGAHLAVLKRKEALLQAPKLEACLDTMRCQLELATQNLLQYVLTVSAVVQAGSADWQLKVVLLDATVGDVADQQQKRCPGCSAGQAADLLAQTAAQVLAHGPLRPRGMLAVESIPVGAQVAVGGRVVGVTPVRRDQWAGPLRLTITHPGYRTQNAAVTLDEGQTVTLKLALTASPQLALPRLDAPPHKFLPRPRWLLGAGGATLAVGATGVGLGIYALASHLHCGPDAPHGMACPSYFLPGDSGAAVVVVGGALLLVGGVTLMALPGRRQRVGVAAAISAGGVGASAGIPR